MTTADIWFAGDGIDNPLDAFKGCRFAIVEHVAVGVFPDDDSCDHAPVTEIDPTGVQMIFERLAVYYFRVSISKVVRRPDHIPEYWDYRERMRICGVVSQFPKPPSGKTNRPSVVCGHMALRTYGVINFLGFRPLLSSRHLEHFSIG